MNKKLLAMRMIHITGACTRLAPIQRHPPHPDDGCVLLSDFRNGGLALWPSAMQTFWITANLPHALTLHSLCQFSFGLIVIVEVMLRTMLDVLVLDESGTLVLPNIGVRGLNPLRSGAAL